MALDSKNANVVSTYGLLLARAGQTKQASELLKQAVELDPSSDIARFYSGMTLQRLGEVEQALQAYRKVLELNPANAAGHLYLANLLAQQGDTDQAMVHWRLATEYNPKLHQAVFALVNAYNKQGQYANADELLSGKLKRKPNDVVILNAYAAHLAKCPDPQLRDGAKAIRTAEKIVAIRGIDDAGSLLFLAAVLAETGDFERAIETLEDAHKANLGGRNNPELARLIQSRQQQYRDRKPAGL